MLNNDDLAELIESTRDRMRHMGGDTPVSVGVVHVLNGLITMLRDQVQEDAPASDVEPASYEEPSVSVAQDDPAEPARDEQQVPGYLQHLRSQRGQRRRPARQSDEAPKPANPLLNPQYADFFNTLIAQQKGSAPAPESASEPPPQDEPAPHEPDSQPPADRPTTFRDETATG